MGQKYQDTFKRYELKYLVREEQYESLMKELESYMSVDQYGKTTISNIYMDTSDYLLIRRSIEKPVYKEKLRIRTYGNTTGETPAFIELKKKYKKVVYKRRISIPYEEARKWIIEGRVPKVDGQIVDEIKWFLKLVKGLKPAIVLCYERIALYGKEDPELRVTLDERIRWRDDDLNLCSGTEGQELLNQGDHLMEIKIAGSMPLWLVRILDELRIYPVSYSKYGRAYLQLQQQKKFQKEIG